MQRGDSRHAPSLYFKTVITTLKIIRVGSVPKYEYLWITTGVNDNPFDGGESTHVMTRLNAPGCLPESHFKQANLS